MKLARVDRDRLEPAGQAAAVPITPLGPTIRQPICSRWPTITIRRSASVHSRAEPPPVRIRPAKQDNRPDATVAVPFSWAVQGSSFSTLSMTRGRMARPPWNSGSPKTADVPGSGVVTTPTVSRPSTWTSVARELTACAWSLAPHPGWATNPPRRLNLPRAGLRSIAPPPLIQLQPPQVGTGVNSGKVAIAWRASDLHLAPKSVSLFWKPDQPAATWEPIIDGLENVGQFVWTVPANVPPRFHIKVEAVDTLGHRGAAETTDMGPIAVDRSRPRSRIIGLDSGPRAGAGPNARPLR